jgi:hypothetical protein
MQKTLLPLLILLVSFSACAQPSHLDQFYQKFNAAGSDVGSGFINPSLLLNISCSDPDSCKWRHKITLLRFLTIDGSKTPTAGREWNELDQSLHADRFEEWISIRKGKGHVRLLSKDRKDGQEDIVCLIVDKEGNGIFFHLRGSFSAADKTSIEAAFQDRKG